MFIHLIAQLPPTPTAIPDGMETSLELPNSLFWPAAPDVVGFWNNANKSGFFTVVQFFIVAILVVLFLGLLYRAFRQISQ